MDAVKILILSIFILMYLIIIVFSDYKVFATGITAIIITAIMLGSKNTNIIDIISKIKFDVIFMLLGIMLVVGAFAESNMPNKIADKLISRIHGSVTALVLISVLSGIISAFVDNVATVLMLAPIGLAVSKKIGVSPIPVLIAISVSSNLQGAATLVGDTTSIMLADSNNMTFFDFFFFKNKFSIFWSVELGALLTVPVLIYIFRKDKKKLCYESENIIVKSLFPTIMLCLTMCFLVVFSFIDFEITLFDKDIKNGLLCLTMGIISVIVYSIAQKSSIIKNVKNSVDYQTVLFLLFLFIIIACVEKVGIIADLSNLFAKIGNSNMFLLYTVIVFGSVILSAFIDNIPFVATMLPVISGLTGSISGIDPTALYFGLLIGSTLGGNITPVGASANVVAMGILKKDGYKVKSSDFFKIGIPFTIVAVLSGYIFTWLVWGI